MNSLSIPTGANAEIIDVMYRTWLDNPDAVDPTWRAFFQGFSLGSNGGRPSDAAARDESSGIIVDSLKQSHVHYLIAAYRSLGHYQSHIDPLSEKPAPYSKLQLSEFSLSDADLNTSFDIGTYLGGGQMKLKDVIAALEETYCGYVGVEYTHIQDQECRKWLQDRIESTRLKPTFSDAQKVRSLRHVHKA